MRAAFLHFLFAYVVDLKVKLDASVVLIAAAIVTQVNLFSGNAVCFEPVCYGFYQALHVYEAAIVRETKVNIADVKRSDDLKNAFVQIPFNYVDRLGRYVNCNSVVVVY